MTREEAIRLVRERDSRLDPLSVKDFCEFCGYSERDFWAIMDTHYNREIFKKDQFGQWCLKNPIWEEDKK